MIKMINGYAEKVFPWYSVSSADNGFTFTTETEYLTRDDFRKQFTEDVLNCLYEETLDCGIGNGTDFVVKVNGCETAYISFEDDDIEGLTIEEIADTVFDELLEWFVCEIEEQTAQMEEITEA